jgi:drug/metabolite transporter (DMT)-like permease
MTAFIFWVLTTLALFINFRFHEKFRINTFQAIVFNYFFCVLTGALMMRRLPALPFEGEFQKAWYIAGFMGVFFVSSFYLSALSTNKVGIAVTGLAGRMSLIVPVLFNIFIFGSVGEGFGFLNYAGILLAVLAIFLSIMQFEKKQSDWQRKPTLFRNDMIWLPAGVFLVTGFIDTVLNYASINFVGKTYAADFSILLFAAAGGAGFLTLLFKYIRYGEKIAVRNIVAGAALGLPNFFSVYLMFVTLENFGYNGAVIFPVFNVSVIITSVLTAMLLFRERFFWYNFLGMFFAVVAVALIAS